MSTIAIYIVIAIVCLIYAVAVAIFVTGSLFHIISRNRGCAWWNVYIAHTRRRPAVSAVHAADATPLIETDLDALETALPLSPPPAVVDNDDA